jgi:hypothetical protein
MADGPPLAGNPQKGAVNVRLLVVAVVVLGLVVSFTGQVAEGELSQCFGVMGRQHQAEVIDAGRCRRSGWQGLRHLTMHVTTEDERDRLASRMTFPVHVQMRQILGIEAQFDAPTNQRLIDGVPIASQRNRSGGGDAAHD